MANFKSLKIENEMTEEFSNYEKSKLKKLLESSYFENPHITNKQENQIYCTIKVIDCKYENWWYYNLIGFSFFCRIIFQEDQIKEFKGVKISDRKEIIFRDFDPDDVIII